MSNVKKNATLGIGRGFNTIVNFLFLPYLSRSLSYNDYGSYGQTLLIVTFIVALLSFGLPQIIYIFLNNHKIETTLTSNLFGTIILAFIGFLFILILKQNIAIYFDNQSLNSLLFLYSISLFLTLPFQSINSYLIFKNKVKVSAAVALISNLIKVLLVFVAIQHYSSVFYAFLGILISQFIQLIICIAYAWKDLEFKTNFKLLFQQIKEGFPLGLTGILGTGILYIDSVMVSRIEGLQFFAIYLNEAIEASLVFNPNSVIKFMF